MNARHRALGHVNIGISLLSISRLKKMLDFVCLYIFYATRFNNYEQPVRQPYWD